MPDDARHAWQHSGRGREATAPQQIPGVGWKDILWRSWQEISDNNIFLAAGGVTYAVLLALFPALAALVAVYALVTDPGQIQAQVDAMALVLPEQTRQMVQQELQELVSASRTSLGFGAVLGFLFALWSASRGMSGMMSALDIAYEEKERRSFLTFNLTALVLTLGVVAGGILTLALIAGLPVVADAMGLSGAMKWLSLIVQWPILLVLLTIGLAVLYRYAPDREEPQWRWVSPGALAAAVIWLVASIGFTIYVSNFASYDKTYGTLGGVVVLLTWLYISSLVVLVGAVINAQVERQTTQDTTSGRPEELGRRGARAADRVAASTE